MDTVYIIACVSEDSYVNIDSVWLDYNLANNRCDELDQENEREWEIIPGRVNKG